MALRPAFVALAALPLTVLVGCAATPSSPGELERLSSEVAALRAQQTALILRLEGLERRHTEGVGAPMVAPVSAPAKATPSGARPMLEVVRLSPEQITPPIQDELPTRPVEDRAKAEFAAAKQLFDKRAFSDAAKAFAALVAAHPDHPLGDLAIYHRGLSLAEIGEHKKAAEQLEVVAVAAGASDLTADALLALAKAYDRLGDRTKAKSARERIKSDFPESAAAKRLPR